MKTTTIARIQAKAVLPALLVASVTESSIAEQAVPAVVVGQFSDSASISSRSVVEAEVLPSRAYAMVAAEWTKPMAKRFRELARKEALDTISDEESRELEGLAHDRRNLEYPRTTDEVLWEINQRRVTVNLVQALKDYVQFHEPSRPARVGAK